MFTFLVHHVHVLGNGVEDVKLIGVYSSEDKANKVISRLVQQPGFVGSPDGFSIDKYEVDEDHWSEGFVTETSADWSVLRQDDNGNEIEMATGLTEDQAHEVVRDFTSRGHKQIYWVTNARNSAV